MELAGPCRLSPAIKSTTEWVKQQSAKDYLFYCVLLILTDGEVEDMDATISAIIEASSCAMSILIVGIGAGGKKFDNFVILDGDQRVLKDKSGKSVERDMVQFVEFNESKGMEYLRNELLTELPQQVVEYFKIKKIKPIGVL